mmetsp:Transcript_96497/g.242055  ORF Transcript_96497/g.242055 Transcript_96497/m.242055 type:complete len:714 (+) Transcript_96497:158-2299(+)
MLSKILPLVVWAFTTIPAVAGLKTSKAQQHEGALQAHAVELNGIAERFELGQHGSAPAPKVADIVVGLNKVVKTLKGHESSVEAVAQTRKKECVAKLGNHSDLRVSIRRGNAIMQRQDQKMKAIDIAIDGHKAKEKEIQGQIARIQNTTKDLNAQLKKLRSDHLAINGKAKASLQELSKIIARVTWQEQQQQKGSDAEPAELNHDVVSLQELGRQLTTVEDPDALALLQTGAESGSEGSGKANHRSVGNASDVLQEDRQALLQARRAESQDFEEKEKKLMGMIDAQHKRLKDLEAQLSQEQLVLADKVQQYANTRREYNTARLGFNRDNQAVEAFERLCKAGENLIRTVIPLRKDVINTVVIPAELLRTMDTAMFLAKDLKDFKASPPSFLQLDSESVGSQDASEDDETMQGEPALSDQNAGEDRGDIAGSAMLQQGTDAGMGSGAGSEDEAAGPFNSVISMIKTLLQDIRNQANQDTNLQQWCIETAATTQRDRYKIKQQQNDLSTKMVWAEVEIKDLAVEIDFLGNEAKRLAKFKDELIKDNETEGSFVDAQSKDNSAILKVLAASASALTTICKLDAGSKNKQCKEAVDMLGQAQKKLSTLEANMQKYKTDYSAVMQEEIRGCKTAVDEGKTSMAECNVAKAKREKELATAKVDIKQKVKDLSLVEESMRQAEQKCSVRETHEERMARRQSEIEALKTSLKVLNGEEVPV